jgi:hypothetical protein
VVAVVVVDLGASSLYLSSLSNAAGVRRAAALPGEVDNLPLLAPAPAFDPAALTSSDGRGLVPAEAEADPKLCRGLSGASAPSTVFMLLWNRAISAFAVEAAVSSGRGLEH